eukprot:Colp12_sorted_trinity150504_noHs@22084
MAKSDIQERLRKALATLGELDSDIVDYVLELYVSSDLSEDEIRDMAKTTLTAEFPKMGHSRIENVLDLLDSAIQSDEDQEEDDLDLEETKQREGSCQMCGSLQRITLHHLIPKLVLKRMRNAGKAKVDVSKYLVEVCRPCHNELHRLFGHGELATYYHTIDSILQAPELQPFLLWKRKRERTLVFDCEELEENRR